MIDQFRRPMRIFPRNTTAEEKLRDRDAFDRIAADIVTPSAITPPARVSWWKRLFGKVG